MTKRKKKHKNQRTPSTPIQFTLDDDAVDAREEEDIPPSNDPHTAVAPPLRRQPHQGLSSPAPPSQRQAPHQSPLTADWLLQPPSDIDDDVDFSLQGTPVPAAATAAAGAVAAAAASSDRTWILFQQAVYNGAALTLFLILGLLVFHNIVIFSGFLHSLGWACIVGVGLFSLKALLVGTLDRFLMYSQTKEIPVPIALFSFAFRGLFHYLDHKAKHVARLLREWIYLLFATCLVGGTVVICVHAFRTNRRHVHRLMIHCYEQQALFLSLTLGLYGVTCFLQNSRSSSDDGTHLRKGAYHIAGWLCLSAFFLCVVLPVMTHTFGLFTAVILSSAAAFLLATGSCCTTSLRSKQQQPLQSLLSPNPKPHHSAKKSVSWTPLKEDHHRTSSLSLLSASLPSPSSVSSSPGLVQAIDKNDTASSDFYFSLLYAACAVTVLRKWFWVLLSIPFFLWLVPLFAVLAVYFIAAIAGRLFRCRKHPFVIFSFLWQVPMAFLNRCVKSVATAAPQVFDVVHTTWRGVIEIDFWCSRWFRRNLDSLVASFLMVLSTLAVILGMILFAMQVNHEATHLMAASQHLWDEHVAENEQLQKWLNTTIWQNKQVQQTANATSVAALNAVRGWVGDQAKALLGPGFNITVFETHFQHMLLSDLAVNGSTIASQVAPRGVRDLMRQLSQSVYSGSFDLAALKESLSGVPLTVLQTIAFRVPYVVLTLVGAAGKSVIDLFFALVVFTSTLYVLLSSEKYAPMEMATVIFIRDKGNVKKEITHVINDVFLTTFKMAAFHFLLTWVSFELLNSEFVYVPSYVAAVASVFPFVPAFLVAVPYSTLLWLTGRSYAALALFATHFGSWWFVMPAIHSGIQNDPYITSLSIVGGLTAFGLSGVFIGPILVCILQIGLILLQRVLQADPAAPDAPIEQPIIDPETARKHRRFRSPFWKPGGRRRSLSSTTKKT